MATPRDRTLVVGAGSSGIVTVKTLLEHGLPFDCFEMGSALGGNWRAENDNGRPVAYDSLHIDTSKERMAFSDFPMPEEYPNYPHHTQVLAYFESYADRFDLRPAITFGHRVDRVAPDADGGYRASVTNLADGLSFERHYRAVIVANGHHWSPRIPDLPGAFAGPALHSRSYRRPDAMAGETVLVVGIGNSGADIACDLAPVAGRTLLAARRMARIIPRRLLGRPTDAWVTPLSTSLPLGLQRLAYGVLLRLARGRQTSWGAPPPATRLLGEHPTLSTDLLPHVRAGRVVIKPGVAALEGTEVRFEDGSREPVDRILWATGFRIRFPFFEPGLVETKGNEIALYRRVAHPDHRHLYFLGLVQPLGAIMPLAEIQARWVAGLLTGELDLPDRTTMLRSIDRDRARLRKRYTRSPRHTIQVDFFPYRRELRRELARWAT